MLVGCISEKMASYFSRWIHALGIDAGCVALLGYLLVCRVANVPANLGYGWVLLITVVLAYMGDRWLDASRQPLFSMTLPRHGIYVRHRFAVFVSLVGWGRIRFLPKVGSCVEGARRCVSEAYFSLVH